MTRLLAAGVTLDQINCICLSHFHLDHSGELAPFLFALQNWEFAGRRKLAITGGPGLKSFLAKLFDLYGSSIALGEQELAVYETAGGDSIDLGWGKIRTAAMNHKPESLAYRFCDAHGNCLTISGDTDQTPDLAELAQHSDIFICEAAMPDDRKTAGHLTPKLAGAIAKQAKVKTLVLTHFYPPVNMDDARKAVKDAGFKGELVLATDLMRLAPGGTP